MKALKWTASLIIILLALAAAGGYLYLRKTLPDYNGRHRADTLLGTVEIIRDSYGMPHIYAENDADAFFALGFCQAQDRLFQMDMARRAGRGTLSEVLGKGLVDVDRLFRTLNAVIPLDRFRKTLSPEVASSLQSFTNGINYFLQNRKCNLPPEFTILGYSPSPWTVEDTLSVVLFMGWAQNYAFKTELLHSAIINKVGSKLAHELFIDYPSGYPATISDCDNPVALSGLSCLRSINLACNTLGVGPGGASNAWAVAPQRTGTGHALFAADPHLNLAAPSLYYESHISTPSMNVSGSMFAGMPFYAGGANDHIAWGSTNSHYDDADFYIEKLHPEDPHSYLYKGRWERMKLRKETIRVRGGDDVTVNVALTRHGPVIDDLSPNQGKKGYAMSMRWSQSDFPNLLRGFWQICRAKNIKEIETAAGHTKSGQNWVYADDNGNIGYYFLGGVPVRKGFTGELPVPGWNGRYEWGPYLPAHMQPHVKNPRNGYAINANNRVEPDGYPYVLTKYYATPDRYMRIEEMIRDKKKLFPEDFMRMQADTLMVMAREWIPHILRSLEQGTLTETEKAALGKLKSWDFISQKDSAASAIFNVFMNYIAENTFRKRLGDTLYEYYLTGDKNIPFNVLREIINTGASEWFDDPDTPQKEDRSHILAKSFRDSVSFLEKELGYNVEKWQWGKLHTLTMYHPFGKKSKLMGLLMNHGPFPADGSIFTVNPTYFKISKSYAVQGGGASFRHVIDFSDMKNSKRILAGGVSGNFMSPHYDDQLPLWLRGEYRPFLLGREEVESDATYRMVMIPSLNKVTGP